MPILRSTPARITEIGVGASTCASGSQVWNGNAGILIAKPMKSAIQQRCWKPQPSDENGQRPIGCVEKLAPAAASFVKSKVCGSLAK